ncbi:MAG TPA: sigma-54 dependent transcriptional regulator [Candidatus Saccharimonadales bacterium]|nr:sigma-54 dependent transcriptional regulator [Candidatus Saccharimonadales bacterium]
MTAAYNMLPSLRPGLSILIATPNESLRKQLENSLSKVTRVAEASTGAEALYVLEHRGARIVVLDRKLPDLNCDELIGVIEHQFPGTDVVLLDGESGEIELPEDLRASAAYQWFREFNQSKAHTPVRPLRTEYAASNFMPLPGMVGRSEAIQQLASLVRVVARHTTSVLICGETGAGKELVSEAVHKLSSRADKPFITVNCAAIPEALVEAELFGHTRGAFTGAVQARIGKIHSAHGGTIFFDEVGELPLASQAKLLRFLECGEVQRLGTSDVFRLDARVIAATNVDLEKRVEQGLFREDLFYRLSIFPIELPPLRDRSEDIPLLARHFLERFSGASDIALSAETEVKLSEHYWPGNVRELRNVIERAFVLADGCPIITPQQIVLRKPVRSARAGSEIS